MYVYNVGSFQSGKAITQKHADGHRQKISSGVNKSSQHKMRFETTLTLNSIICIEAKFPRLESPLSCLNDVCN